MEFNLSKDLKYIFDLFKNYYNYYYCKYHNNYKYNSSLYLYYL